MKKAFSLSLLVITLVSISCYVLLVFVNTQAQPSKTIKNAPASTGTVHGTVGMYMGNCMPSTEAESCKPYGTKSDVYITKPTEKFDKKLLVKKVESDETGNFETALKPGSYSLFVYDNNDGWQDWNSCDGSTYCDKNGAYSCDHTICENNICFCNLFVIKESETTEVNSKIDHAAW